jgi:hypothetical protein
MARYVARLPVGNQEGLLIVIMFRGRPFCRVLRLESVS